MIMVPERGPWKALDRRTQERDLRRYRLRRSLFGGLHLQLQVERRVWDFEIGTWRHSFAWRRARPADMPPVFSIIAEIAAYGGSRE